MSELTTLDIAAARDALAKGEFTSEELTAAYLEAIDAAKVLNAYITVLPGKAIEMAKESDARRKGRRGGRAGRYSSGDQGPVLHRGCADDRGQPYSGWFSHRRMKARSPAISGSRVR